MIEELKRRRVFKVGADRLLAGTMGGDAAARAAAIGVVDECLAAKPEPTPTWAVVVLMRLDQPARALALMARPLSDDTGSAWRTWAPLGAGVRHEPGFAAYAREIGLTVVWDRYGAPDLCERRAPGEYACR